MKHNNFPRELDQRPAGEMRLTAAADLNQGRPAFAPSADEVAGRAYFAYLNEGSLPGRELKHWLEAEAHLLAEFSRAQGFHNSHN